MALHEEIAELLELPEDGAGAPSLDAIESMLTDGYAEALALEAKRAQTERRMGEVARGVGDTADLQEFARLSASLESADGELERLRALLRTLQARRRSARLARS